MKAWKAAAYSYAFFFFANVIDVLSSIGKDEMNPLMQTSLLDSTFCLKKALIVKSIYTIYFLTLAVWTYAIVSQINRTLAFLVVAIIPMQASYGLALVAFHNLL